jgi:oxaloacetate decarboxylase (Na+ extruding) subunit gamma
MNELVQDGFGLLVLGMGFVFLFLVLLIFITGYMSKLINNFFPEAVPIVKKSVTVAAPVSLMQDSKLKSVVQAAINQHREAKK